VNLVWQDPPPSNKGNRSPELDALAEALKAHPGRWALVANDPYSGGGQYHRNRGLEFVCRSKGDGTYDKYARYPEQ
jgi:hypothetical protein